MLQTGSRPRCSVLRASLCAAVAVSSLGVMTAPAAAAKTGLSV
jgi:hypothetical protein